MRWNHLPVAGGLYDQHPKLLAEWQVLFEEKAAHQKREQEKRDREMKSKRGR